MQTVEVSPEIIRWARGRADISLTDLVSEFPKYLEWESGSSHPTFKQLQRFSKLTYTPFGYFFLASPPEEKLPIQDFRTVGGKAPHRPSPNLLETVQMMQKRQSWLRDELIEQGRDPLTFVGSAKRRTDAANVAAMIRGTLGLSNQWAATHSSWEKALSAFRDCIEAVGILVVKNGVVGNDVHRKLDPEEFRGFVLCDDYAPLIFVNGRDAVSAQMFTLAHELAHVWMGRGGIFDLADLQPANDKVEKLCNQVAAELLIPSAELHSYAKQFASLESNISAIASHFRVSPIVAARRALDLHLITRDAFFKFYHQLQIANSDEESSKGGNFYSTQYSRIGKRFGLAVIHAVHEGRLLYRDAYQLTGLHGKVFDNFATRIESGSVE